MKVFINRAGRALYSAAQGLVITTGVVLLGWTSFAGLHDVRISIEGQGCAWTAVGSDKLVPYEGDDPSDWTRTLVRYSESLPRREDVHALKDLLEKTCPRSLRVHVFDFTQKAVLAAYPRSLVNNKPATVRERVGYVLVVILGTSAVFGILYVLRRAGRRFTRVPARDVDPR